MPTVGVTGSSAIQYTVADLVQMVQDMTFVSGSQRDWPAPMVVRLLNRCLFNYLVPFVAATDGEFYIVFRDQPIVTGQQNYAFPTGCHNGNLRIVQLLTPVLSGGPTIVLPQRELDVGLTPTTLFGLTNPLGTPSSFYIEANQMFLLPIPTVGTYTTLRVHYPLRPSQLVSPFDYSGPGGTSLGLYNEAFEATLTAVSPTSLTLANVPNSPVFYSKSPFVAQATTVDVISADPPFDILATASATIPAQTAGSVPSVTTLSIGGPSNNPTDLNANLQVGQTVWLSVTGTAPVVTATPIEVAFGLMTQWAIAKVLESKGDDTGYQRARASLTAEEEKAKQMLRRRVRGPGKRCFASPYTGKGGRGIVAIYT